MPCKKYNRIQGLIEIDFFLVNLPLIRKNINKPRALLLTKSAFLHIQAQILSTKNLWKFFAINQPYQSPLND